MKFCCADRCTLHTQSIRLSSLSENRLEPSSLTLYSSLTSTVKDVHIRKLYCSVKKSIMELKYLKEKLEEVLKTRSTPVEDDVSDDLHTIMESKNSSILKEFPEGSFAKLFWKQQLDA